MSFTSFPLDSLGLRKDQVAVCQRNNFHTAADVLRAPTHDLTKKLKWRIEAVQALVRDVSRAVAPRTSSVGVLTCGAVEGEAIGEGSTQSATPGRGRSQGQIPSRYASAASQGAGAAYESQAPLGLSTPAGGYKGRRKGNASRMPKGGHEEGDWISTGDEGWDRLLGGGVRLGTLVEISGESAAGKSHLALSLAVAAQLPTLSTLPGGTIFLTSEREISTSRLQDISRHMLATHGKSDFRTPSRLMAGVITDRVGDVDALELALGYRLPAMLDRARGEMLRLCEKNKEKERVGGEGQDRDGKAGIQSPVAAAGLATYTASAAGRLMSFQPSSAVKAEYEACKSIVNAERLNPAPLASATSAALAATGSRTNTLRRTKSQGHSPRLPIRLIVLDSIAALLRGAETSFSSSSAGLTARSRFLCSVADRLKALAVEYNLAVVVINQVSDVIDRRGMTSFSTRTRDDEDDEDDEDASAAGIGGTMRPPAYPNGASSSQLARPSQVHPSSSQSQPGITHSQAWATTGPDPPMLYATQSKWFSGQSSAKTKEAALGVVWANAINVRIMLSRTGRRRVIGKDDVPVGVERSTKRRWVDGVGLGRHGVLMAGDESGVAMAQARADAALSQHRSVTSGYALGEGQVGQGDDIRVEWHDTAGPEPEEDEERVLIRRAACVFSPHAASATVDYVITTSGIHTLNDSWKRDDTGDDVWKRQKRRAAALAGDGHGHNGPEAGEEDEADLYGDGDLDGLMDVPDEWWNGDVSEGAMSASARRSD